MQPQAPHASTEVATAPRNAAAFAHEADDVFARIAGRYDLLCDIFSVFAHRIWKARMAAVIAERPAAVVLDLASGTGHIPLRLLRRLARRQDGGHGGTGPQRILVTDVCKEMLALARQKIGTDDPKIEYLFVDAHDARNILSASVDLCSISFAMKICDRTRVTEEAFRVLKPGGTFLCLEAARIPVRWLHAAYLKYMDLCLPFMARVATGGDASAYDYFLRGIHGMPSQDEFARELEAQGFRDVTYENLTLGIVALHRAVKP